MIEIVIAMTATLALIAGARAPKAVPVRVRVDRKR